MLFDRARPHAVRERRTTPTDVEAEAARAVAAAERRAARTPACEAWAVHRATDGTRVVTVEAWRSVPAFSAAAVAADLPDDAAAPDTPREHAGLYAWAGTGGREPTPVADATAGVIVIDLFPVWRPLVRPVSAFNVRNGEAFTHQPGCVSTTVLRGLSLGGIATYARWRTEADFLAAFSAVAGAGRVDSMAALNRAAARKTRGLIRPDYHAYVLVAFREYARGRASEAGSDVHADGHTGDRSGHHGAGDSLAGGHARRHVGGAA